VVYVLSFVPTYVDWELRELARRGVALCVVLPASFPRASMWDHITGSDRSAEGGPGVRTADFHAWLEGPARTLARPGSRVLARWARRAPRTTSHLALRCLRDRTFRHFLAAGDLADALRAQPIARVHSHFATDAACVGALLAELLGVPFSVTTHAKDIFVPRFPRRLKRVLASAAPAFTISHFNRAHLERTVGASTRRVHVLHLGVCLDALPHRAPAADVFTIACTASGLVDKKGVGVLVEACRLLDARGFRFRCEVCGTDPGGERLAALRALVRESGLATLVSLHGALPWTATQQLVARAAVFVLPSIRTAEGDMDGIPVSLIEAMGIGVPVVSSRLSGIPELVEHGRTGLLVPPGDPAALAAAIERIARDPSLASALGSRARQRVRDGFSLSRYVDGLLDGWSQPTPSAGRATTRRAG
jgi:glycosyltransferase involved in cell wall biosynthesis